MKESLLISQAIAAPILPIYFIGGKCPGLLIHTQSSFGQIFSSNDLTCLLGSIIHHFSLEKVNNLTCVSVKFSSVIHLTVDNYYLRGFGFISISVSLWQVFPWGKKKLHKRLYALPGILAYSFSSYASAPHYGHS